MEFIYSNYLVRLLNKNNKGELIEVQKLRYDYLLREFNPALPEEGIDDDGYDDKTDSILIIDTNNNKIIGTYRLATLATAKENPFKTEGEFNIDAIKNCGKEVVELGRAVVHKDYRNGVTIQLLGSAIFQYAIENNCKYLFGTCSFHGVDPTAYSKVFSYIKKEVISGLNVYAVHDSFEFGDEEYDKITIKEETPSLLKSYISLGCKIGKNGFIDYEFNSCDVLIVVDLDDCNEKIVNRMMRFGRTNEK